MSADEELNTLRARVAELEAAAAQVAKFCAQRAEYVRNARDYHSGGDADYWRWNGHAEARRQLSQLLGLPVGWPAEDALKCSVCGNTKVKIKKRLFCPTCIIPQQQTEDPHASALPHDYALGRDLPAIPHQRDEEAL